VIRRLLAPASDIIRPNEKPHVWAHGEIGGRAEVDSAKDRVRLCSPG
jgi:hypothetical protein